jgi:peptidyl-prolyl cis-trans isomerase B (cyclophilin B)
MDVVDRLVELPRDTTDRPKTPPVMKKVTVETLGVSYPEPKKIKLQ